MGKGRAGREVAVSALQSACTDDISTSLATAEREIGGYEGSLQLNYTLKRRGRNLPLVLGSVRSRGTQAMALQGAGILVYSTAIGSEPQELNFHDH
ncbi:hypothetical protein DKX38_022251 [Salix brachista]|uniref:Uncharacterized protein n=1 Tax=Salix brachista TaxID=2182728 RepID=A0A5N5JZQ9_9ROSI|nr:hypothetical protein DKX38_022251 [Salix brachista]